MATKRIVQARNSGIHPDNRGGSGVDPFNAQDLVLKISKQGYSETKLEQPMGFEKALSGPLHGVQKAFNDRIFSRRPTASVILNTCRRHARTPGTCYLEVVSSPRTTLADLPRSEDTPPTVNVSPPKNTNTQPGGHGPPTHCGPCLHRGSTSGPTANRGRR